MFANIMFALLRPKVQSIWKIPHYTQYKASQNTSLQPHYCLAKGTGPDEKLHIVRASMIPCLVSSVG